MSAIMLRKADEQEKILNLEHQLRTGDLLQNQFCEEAKEYLIQRGIYDVTLIEEYDFREYASFLARGSPYTKTMVVERTAALRKLQKYWVEKEYGELLVEIAQCTEAEQSLLGNISRFLIRQGVHHINEIDYYLREVYEDELCRTRTNAKVFSYLKAFDRVKQHSIRVEMSKFKARTKKKPRYEEQKLFLPYISNQKVAMEFDRIQNKNELVWDFTRKAPKNMKRQVHMILHYLLHNVKDPKDRRVRFLLPLRWLYDFCVEHDIEDIERLELVQIQEFEEIVAKKVVNVKSSMEIVDNSRKILFTCAKDIHWYANVWYMERFHLSPDRLNPSNPVQSISFHEVLNKNNRQLLQDFGKYLLGLTGLALHGVRSHINNVKKLLQYFEEESSICNVTTEQLDQYFIKLQGEPIKANTYNLKIASYKKFYIYLEARGHIEYIPFHPEYYVKKEIPVHHDRSVEQETYMEILQQLKNFPEIPRLIYMHLWCTGLRISEVCTLKRDDYYFDGDDAWLQVYQIKLKMEKMIPIPLVLYKTMKTYIKNKRLRSSDYVFQGEGSKGPYRIMSFHKIFRNYCMKNNIADGDYIFRSHDYRHTLATEFYNEGVSIQTIRDYLGHYSEDMTKQYIDYMPKMIAEANEEYFNKSDNNLAAAIKIRKRGEQNEKKDSSV